MNSIWKKAAFFVGLALVLSALTYGAYALLERFLADRRTAIERVSRPERVVTRTTRAGQGRATDPRLPIREGRAVQNPAQMNEAGQAAIQRQLRTLEEINKINEMNRRLQEQQQRINQNNQR